MNMVMYEYCWDKDIFRFKNQFTKQEKVFRCGTLKEVFDYCKCSIWYFCDDYVGGDIKQISKIIEKVDQVDHTIVDNLLNIMETVVFHRNMNIMYDNRFFKLLFLRLMTLNLKSNPYKFVTCMNSENNKSHNKKHNKSHNKSYNKSYNKAFSHCKIK